MGDQTLIELTLPTVTKGSVPEIVAEGDGFNKLSVETQGAADGFSNVGDVEHVLHARADMVITGIKKDLCFLTEAAKFTGIEDASYIPLVAAANFTGLFLFQPASAAAG